MAEYTYGWEAIEPAPKTNPQKYDLTVRLNQLYKERDDIIERALSRGEWAEGEQEEVFELDKAAELIEWFMRAHDDFDERIVKALTEMDTPTIPADLDDLSAWNTEGWLQQAELKAEVK